MAAQRECQTADGHNEQLQHEAILAGFGPHSTRTSFGDGQPRIGSDAT